MVDMKMPTEPVQPNENNGGASVPMDSSTDNKTKAYPGTGAKMDTWPQKNWNMTKEKGRKAWAGYGKDSPGVKTWKR